MVPNHTADYFAGTSTTYSPSTYKPASPLDDPDYFHHDGDCLFDGSMNQAQLETCELSRVRLRGSEQEVPFVRDGCPRS